jgi:hypothetical protein
MNETKSKSVVVRCSLHCQCRSVCRVFGGSCGAVDAKLRWFQCDKRESAIATKRSELTP